MKLNRRTFLAASAAGAAIGAPLATPALAEAQDADVATLHKAPTLGDMVLGPKEAPVTIVEYASATCGHCANFHNGTFKELKKEYVDTGKVRFIFREFPFDDLALAAFMLARCAPADKYFAMIDIIFEKQSVWIRNPREELLKIAKLAGFTEEKFDKCLRDEKIAKGIAEIRDFANKQYGVDSTPTFFINGKVLAGNASIETFKQRIEAANS